MKWANFLHIYQPAEQQADILESIVEQSYRPLLQGLQKHARIGLTLNINGALLELFDSYGYHDLLDALRELGGRGQIEFTGSAKYHAFLPFLSRDEVMRQIRLNNETNSFFLGDAYQPKGFYPPEMAYKPELAPLIESCGFSWVILDEIAYNGVPEQVDYTKLYKIKDTNLRVFFRERRLSNLIMSAVVRSKKSFEEAMKQESSSKKYYITAMDGETFGHHRPGLAESLFDILSSKKILCITVSDLLKAPLREELVSPITSTWASSKEDIEKGIQFLSWSDPENQIHTWQWELVRLALNAVERMDQKTPSYKEIRKRMDIALASDHFWWASAKPWWSMEMIEEGAYRLLSLLRRVPGLKNEVLLHAQELYERIVSTGFSWQRTGKIRQMMKDQSHITRIPFKKRTLGRGGSEKGVYYAFLDMMKRLEKEAAEAEEYEKAILWRDAIYKLEHNLDIYDAINAIDLLRVHLPHEEIEKTIEGYKEKYRSIRGGQPEQRGN